MPSGAALTSARTVCALRSVHLLQTTIGAVAVAPHGTPDSPVRQTMTAFGFLLLLSFEPYLGLYIGLC